uniref:Uncharacterized protein n=1 Tax=Arundo donax TaxID=35708 RepID=A0A0A8Z0D3_ARUDO
MPPVTVCWLFLSLLMGSSSVIHSLSFVQNIPKVQLILVTYSS